MSPNRKTIPWATSIGFFIMNPSVSMGRPHRPLPPPTLIPELPSAAPGHRTAVQVPPCSATPDTVAAGPLPPPLPSPTLIPDLPSAAPGHRTAVQVPPCSDTPDTAVAGHIGGRSPAR